MEPFVARNSPRRALRLLAGSLAFVIAGAWTAGLIGSGAMPGREWVGWLGMAFFGLGFCVGLPKLFDRQVSLVISSLGIVAHDWSDEMIPWSEIRAVSVWQHRRTRLIALHLKDPALFASSRLLGNLRADLMVTGGDVAITMVGKDRSTDEALSAIARWIPDKVDRCG